jgi:hypothetical protein
MKSHCTATAAFLATLTLLPAADTFILKDGSKLVGSILKEDATSYTLEVNVTKSIKDERVLAKADVEKVEAEHLDLTAFESIAKLAPAPDLLEAEDYAQRIQQVEKFLSDHRGSPKSKEAKAILSSLKTEANEVLAGGIKIDGKIITLAERRANAYEIDARVKEAKIRRLVSANQSLQALREFAAFEKDFRNTTANSALAPLMKQVITAYTADVENTRSSYDTRVKEREIGLDRMSATDRPITERAIREENAELELQFKKEKDAKIGWVTTHPFFKPSLDDTITFSKQELTRLSAVKSPPAVDGGKIFRDGLALIQSKGDSAGVTALLSAAKSAMIPQTYIAILEAAEKSAKTTH